jgi:DNA-directed RNA polymerase subunit E'/Rpb7
MSDTFITVKIGNSRFVRLTLIQASITADLMQEFEHPVWHLNHCGCCVTVHDADDNTRGYIIGQDGEYDYVDLASDS